MLIARGVTEGRILRPALSCGHIWRREFPSLVPILVQLARSADNAPLFNYHSDNKYWDSLRGS